MSGGAEPTLPLSTLSPLTKIALQWDARPSPVDAVVLIECFAIHRYESAVLVSSGFG